ncbi:EF-hand domain-containing protein [Lysobacter sp. A3-1-A15]|uniref:EF-hand domain-containing protein n=1 Tax=Novilysobacter viscosus TaxID=3098602 RepID=UPI002ED93E45
MADHSRAARARVGRYLVSAALLVAFASQAQVRDTAAYLARMDADGDGWVSLAEYQHWMGYAFERMDLDGDGTLSPHELPGGRGRAVTRQAHLATLADAFRRQDVNGDGALDARELAAPPQ